MWRWSFIDGHGWNLGDRSVANVGLPEAAMGGAMVALVVGFLYAAWTDWRTREVSDHLWQLLAVAGLALGIVATAPSGIGPALVWLAVGLLVIEHFVPWDLGLERRADWLPGVVEVVIYAVVGVGLVFGALHWGIGGGGVPLAAIEVYITVLFARGLFEARILYGGADAKALMVAGLLVPLDPSPLLQVGGPVGAILAIYPFAVTVLFNAALLAIAVPAYLAVRNLRAGEFEFPGGFTGYRIPVQSLPDRFVWIRDPTFHPESEEDEVDTSEDDRKLRERQRDELLRAGATTVWVTPQVPFVVLLALGAIVGLLAGNLAFDAFSLL